MILPILIVLAVLGDTPAAPTLAPAAPVAATPAPPAADPVFAEIDGLMTPWKGKPLGQLQGRLGLSHTIKVASDGRVIFWLARAETTACGVDGGGALRCLTQSAGDCQLGIAVNKDGAITNWKASGVVDSCRKFVAALSAP